MTKLWEYHDCSDRYTTINICQYKFYVYKLVNFIYFIIFYNIQKYSCDISVHVHNYQGDLHIVTSNIKH